MLFSDRMRERRENILSGGKLFFGLVREAIDAINEMNGMPAGMEFIWPKCTGIYAALDEKGEWPSDNAVRWIEVFIGTKEGRPKAANDTSIGGMRYNWEVFKSLRALDGYLDKMDADGFREELKRLKACPLESPQREAYFMAQVH